MGAVIPISLVIMNYYKTFELILNKGHIHALENLGQYQRGTYFIWLTAKQEWGKDVFVEIDVNTSLDRNESLNQLN